MTDQHDNPYLDKEGMLAVFHELGMKDIKIRAVERMCCDRVLPVFMFHGLLRIRRKTLIKCVEKMQRDAERGASQKKKGKL